MAFIRAYSNQGARFALDQGDPFLGRMWKKLRKAQLPKAVRKFQPGRAIGRLAPALSFVPGLGVVGWAARIASLAQRFNVPPAVVEGIAERYGISEEMGDPGKTPRRRAQAKRKNQKPAKRKRSGRRPSGSRQPVDWGALATKGAELLPGVAQAGMDIYREAKRQGLPVVPGASGMMPDLDAVIARELGAGAGKKSRSGAFVLGHKRRSINPVNVKALRRSMRRIEGFQNVVKRVNKMFPKIKHASASVLPARRKKCGCK